MNRRVELSALRLGAACLLASVCAGCEERPTDYAIDSDLPVCGVEEADERGLDCASPVIHVERATDAGTDVLLALSQRGILTATRMAGAELGSEPLGCRRRLRPPLSSRPCARAARSP